MNTTYLYIKLSKTTNLIKITICYLTVNNRHFAFDDNFISLVTVKCLQTYFSLRRIGKLEPAIRNFQLIHLDLSVSFFCRLLREHYNEMTNSEHQYRERLCLSRLFEIAISWRGEHFYGFVCILLH